MKNELNLNGRIVGKTPGGMLLVSITLEEYMESLPVVDPGDRLEIPEGMTRGEDPLLKVVKQGVEAIGAALAPVPAPRRPDGKATPAQRKFNGKRPLKVVREPRGAALAQRVCENGECGKAYQPIRKDQRFCCTTCCRTGSNKARYAKPTPKAKAPAAAAPAATSPAKLTPDQKKERINLIRTKMAKITGNPGRPTDFRISDEPAELTQATREANQE